MTAVLEARNAGDVCTTALRPIPFVGAPCLGPRGLTRALQARSRWRGREVRKRSRVHGGVLHGTGYLCKVGGTALDFFHHQATNTQKILEARFHHQATKAKNFLEPGLHNQARKAYKFLEAGLHNQATKAKNSVETRIHLVATNAQKVLEARFSITRRSPGH